MTQANSRDAIENRRVTYTLEMDGKFYIVENVPARVCVETGEQFFAPETAEKLQSLIWEQQQPKRTVETPVYEFVA